MQSEDQAFLEATISAIVEHPESVSVERTQDERGVLLTLTVHPNDMGRVIGKQGKTANALRTLLKALGAKNKANVSMKLYEPEEGYRQHKDAALEV